MYGERALARGEAGGDAHALGEDAAGHLRRAAGLAAVVERNNSNGDAAQAAFLLRYRELKTVALVPAECGVRAGQRGDERNLFRSIAGGRRDRERGGDERRGGPAAAALDARNRRTASMVRGRPAFRPHT